MSAEGLPKPRSEPHASEAAREESEPENVIAWQEVGDAIAREAGEESDYWSPDYYELLGPDGRPLLDAKRHRIIVDMGQVTLGGRSAAVVKMPTLPESAQERLGKKNKRESSLIRPLASFPELVPGARIAGVRRVPEMHIEVSLHAAGDAVPEKRIERVEAKDVREVQNKGIALLLARGVAPEHIAMALREGKFGPRIADEDVARAIREAKGPALFIEKHSHADLPLETVRSLLGFAEEVANRPVPETSGEELRPAPPVLSKKESMRAVRYGKSEQYLRDLLGDIDDERWSDAKEAIQQLRGELDALQWFSFGTNTADLERRGRFTQLTLAPRDLAQEERLIGVLGRLNIQPWPELKDNLTTLVIEYRRDIEFLRAAMILDYLVHAEDRKGAEEIAKREDERMTRVEAWLAGTSADVGAPDVRPRKRPRQELGHLRVNLRSAAFREKRTPEKAQAIAEFFAAIPEPTAEEFMRPLRAPQDHYFRFGYPNTPLAPGKRPRKKEAAPEASGEDPADADRELEEFERAFDSGSITEETLEQETGVRPELVSQSRAPNLVLFPRKYVWEQQNPKKRGHLRERATGRVVKEKDVLDEVLEARTGTPEQYEHSMRELALMNRTLILWKLRQVLERHPAADPDDLFQAGLRGMAYAVDHYEMRPGTKFNSYLIPCMEGYMRRVAAAARHRAVTAAVQVSGLRKQILDSERALRSERPDEKVEPERLMRSLHDQGIIAEESMRAFDAYLRRVLLSYEETDLTPLEDDALSADDVDMLGRALYVDPESADPAEAHEARTKVSAALRTLTPREERAVRRYFELYLTDEKTAADIYDSLRAQLASEGMSLSSEELKRKIRDLTAEGDLNLAETQKRLSAGDRAIARRYVELLHERAQDETLEVVGQEFSVSRERMRQIIEKAIRKLRHPSRSKTLRSFVRE